MALDPQRLLHGDLFQAEDFLPEPATPDPSRRRVGGYEVVSELARGGMGVVLIARDPALRREVAIKLLHASRFRDGGARSRFLREAETLARLSHPNVVRVHATGLDEGRPFLVMELVAGESLEARLGRGPLSCAEAAALGAALADALAHAHARGIIHRDLKPANVILGDDGAPRLTDFGLALPLDAEGRLSQTGQLLGTPGFWAPEQLGGPRSEVGPWTDVYGLGATLFAALTGECPFKGHSMLELAQQAISGAARRPSALNPEVSAGLESIILRCLEPDPERRFPDAQTLRGALLEDAGRPSRGRAPTWLIAAGALALALGGGMVAAFVAAREGGPAPAASSSETSAADALARCLETRHPDDATLEAGEQALEDAARAGRPVDPERFAALEPGPARWRLRTLALVLAGDPERALAELEQHAHPEARQLRGLVELGLEGLRVDVGVPARGYGSPTAARVRLADLLTNAERAGRTAPAALGRWAFPACQRGIAALAVLARDAQPDRRSSGPLARELPVEWEPRAVALAPETWGAALVRVGAAWTRCGALSAVAQDTQAQDAQTLRSLLSKRTLPPLFEFLAASVLASSESTRAELIEACQRALASSERLPSAVSTRYISLRDLLRQQLAELYLDEAWDRRERDDPAAQAWLARACASAWATGLYQRRGTAAFAKQPVRGLSLDTPTEEALRAIEGEVINRQGARTLVVTLLLAGQLDVAEALLARLDSPLDAQLRALLEAELRLIRGDVAGARAALEALVEADPQQAPEVWVALAHARSLAGDAQGAAQALAASADVDQRHANVPWHAPARGAALLRGEAWWPGAR